MPEVSMNLVNPAQTAILGLPATKPSIINPFYDATELDKIGKHKEAERIYLELLNSDFDNPVLLAALGMNYAVAEKNGLAHLLLQSALSRVDDLLPGFKRVGITPKSTTSDDLKQFVKIKRSELLNAIGTCYKHENRTIEARDYFERAQVDLDINADIQNNLGTLGINEGKPEEAMQYLRAALSVDPNHAQAHWNMSLAYLELGDYEHGWPEYDWGIRAKVRVDRNYSAELLPYWNGEKDARVVVFGEQGIGDEILFASMLPELIANTELVVFDCHKKLHKLFANSFPTIDIYPTREDEMITWPQGPKNESRYNFTHKIAIGSLGKFFRQNLDKFPGTPFLKPTPTSELHWNEELAKLPPGPKIGISWVGGHKKTRVEVRSIELERLLPILSQDAQFISLQYTPCEGEIAAFEKAHGIHIHQFPEAAYSPIYDDAAGLVANLDLVITVATSVIHLAGSMGVPVWVLTASRAAWREYYGGSNNPWYNSMLMFRQAPGSIDWTPVIDETAAALADLLSAIKPGVKHA